FSTRRPPRTPLLPYTTLFRSALLALGRYEEAESLYLRANSQLRQTEKPNPVHAKQIFERLASLYRTWYESSDNPEHLARAEHWQDRKSTRLNSSHVKISYAVF